MNNLCSLTLPSFDLHILRHHSAFGLRYIEFGNTHLCGQAEGELLTWLDGQTNVVSLRFPFLINDASPPTPLPAMPTHTRLLSARHAKPTFFISHASAITAPAYSNADSGHIQSHY